jgi:multicomponent Na+:H+ antiporter subunit A
VLLVLLVLHAALAVAAVAWGARAGRGVFGLVAVAPAVTLLWLGTVAGPVIDGRAVSQVVAWVPAIGLTLGLRLDALGLVMVLLVSGIGLLIFGYAAWYFAEPRADVGRYAGLLCAFSGSMLGLVTADDLIAVFVFWELTSITSYLLIGLQHTKASARAAALQALLVTGMGGLVLLAGLLLLGQAAGTFSLAALVADPPAASPLVTAAALCILVGVATKSAQVPFHSWLPAAMVAPTPVSAYLHSASMVKAGIYLAARLAPVLVVSTGVWRPAAMTMGAATMLLGGWRALRQHDLKLLLAYGTVSQLGFMLVLLSAGTEAALQAGIALLLAHGLFKATLFMVVGIVDHSCGTRDLRRLSGVGRDLPVLAAVGTVAAASMAGLPLLFGFVAKEAALTALLDAAVLGPAAPLWLIAVVLGSVLTVAYSARLVWGAFAAKSDASDPARVRRRPAVAFVAPAGLLAGVSVVLGVLPGLASSLVAGATLAVVPDAQPHALELWHGAGLPLLLTVLIVGAGAVLTVGRRGVERIQARMPGLPSASGAYEGCVDGLLRISGRTASVVQNGSLPVYLGIILVTAVAAPTVALLQAPSAWIPQRFADSPLQVVAILIAVAAAVESAVARRRFAAVLSLGAVGYAVVTIFALHGAPDLALTQLLIETLGLVVFVLALRHLPPTFAVYPWPLSQALRIGIAGAVGVFITGFALVAGRARDAVPGVSEAFLARAADAGGRNVVNVVLVDFRGFDTLGEITVLGVAALGVAALVLARRSGAPPTPPQDAAADQEPIEASTGGGP